MRLCELLSYDQIVIQCHDNPDADAIGSAYGVYVYLKSHGKTARIVYGGQYRIQKSSLCLMVSELEIPIEYAETLNRPRLLLTVDCQYGGGNVTRFEAEEIAVIDHHPACIRLPRLSEVRSHLGSCATVVYAMLKEEGFDINQDLSASTALYYGLFMDTKRFAEISHPLDRDLRDEAVFDRQLMARFQNANVNRQEMTIAGQALINCKYFGEYQFAVTQTEPCDPNLLGMISDLILEVDAVDICLVYCVLPFGIKLSVRSCTESTRANELVRFLTDGIGSGGGHLTKAGGFIQKKLYDDKYPEMKNEKEFFDRRVKQYFIDTQIIVAAKYTADFTGMQEYRMKRIRLGFVEAKRLFPVGTQVSVRTMEGDLEIDIDHNLYIMIGMQGEVYPRNRESFEKNFRVLPGPYQFHGEYEPSVRDIRGGANISLIPYIRACEPAGESRIYAARLEHRAKVFPLWDEEAYLLGEPGDYLAVSREDPHDVYIIQKESFEYGYERV